MIILIAAAAVAAAQPAVRAPTAQHDMRMESGQKADHKPNHRGMDCCPDCCKDMAAKHDRHVEQGADQAGHAGR